MTVKVGVITQARATSTRLPRKILLPVGGKTFLDHHLDRVALSNLSPVVVATTINTDDDPIVELVTGRGLPVYRGSELDVLERFAGAAEENDLDVVVRVTSDCPLIDGRVIAAGVERYLAEGDPRLYAANTLERTYPRGFDFEIFSADLLREAHKNATLPADREHVTSYLHQNRPGDIRLLNLPFEGSAHGAQYRLTLDTEDDRRLLATLIEQYDGLSLDCAELVALMDAHPELNAINQHIEQKKLGE
ncbi:MAG: cytidylyltransferase domain-containing protein [Kribbellaceae bacterium]